MPMNGYSIGRDVTITITLPEGTALDLGKLTKFTSKQEADTQDIKGLDGQKDRLRFFGGWTGSFEAERRGPEVDAYFANLEANYYAGGDEPPATITETILEPSGAVSQFRYERVVLMYDDAGDKQGDKSVGHKISFFARRRVQQA